MKTRHARQIRRGIEAALMLPHLKYEAGRDLSTELEREAFSRMVRTVWLREDSRRAVQPRKIARRASRIHA